MSNPVLKTYEVTRPGTPKVCGKTVKVGQKIKLYEDQAAYELLIGSIVEVNDSKAKPASASQKTKAKSGTK